MKIDAIKWGGALMVIITFMTASAWSAWEWQANAYGLQMAQQDIDHQALLTSLANTQSELIIAEQAKRLALEQWLAASDKTHHRALTDAQTSQARLRDRLATADLRLSVLLDAADTGACSAVSATTSSGRVVHGAPRAQLDRAHAQRIIDITSDGDQGLIALQACQQYLEKVVY